MRSLNASDPKQFIADFFTSYMGELLRSDGDPALIVDRYHTPDVVQIADGHRMDRDKLIAHTRPVRKNRPSGRLEVHEALADGDRIAAHYTLHVRDRKRALAVEVYFFGQFTPDGRMRRAKMLTRTIPAARDGVGVDVAAENGRPAPDGREAGA
ncbi:nuclear transport factor 2 family protein [Micromonospora deserti]|uniref:nuclear transport factor 2 family protein n=1 Tax=Micromonospora deserti TaxID=2070366 RepID=UPI000DA94427|nr:nuclear transport factor 2 family protein [Micromonospora deserti]